MQSLARRFLHALLAGAFTFAALRACPAQVSSPLQVVFGKNGLQSISYNGTRLVDLVAHPDDRFYIGHMKATDLAGKELHGGQFGWGEVNQGKAWNADTHTWAYQFTWGSIAVQYLQHGPRLDILTTVSNNRDSGIILDGAAVFPAVLHFPRLPNGFGQPNYPQVAFNTVAPSVTVADWGSGEVAAVVPDPVKPLYSGFWPAQSAGGTPYSPEISGTSPDGLAAFQPHNDRPVRPGETDHYTVSLRFARSGTPLASIARDAYANWSSTYPSKLRWTDRRPIGTVYLASSPQAGADAGRPGGFPHNPRRYFNSDEVDTVTHPGLAEFQRRILSLAADIANNAQRLHAQGVITWDIEGEEYPQATSYVCAPDAIGQAAPEMEKPVNLPDSPWNGKKLDDAYFGIIRNAGLRIGVCLRPQRFTLKDNGRAEQVFLAPQDIPGELVRKARYAHDRWGATLFYVDSTVDKNGGTLPASLFERVQAALPDSLIIPEETTPLSYAYTAPFKSFIDLGAVGTEVAVLAYYPHAFSAVLVNDADPTKLATATPQLVAHVKHGDILMGHVDYWQENNAALLAIYSAAGVSISAPGSAARTIPSSASRRAVSPAQRSRQFPQPPER